MSIKAYQQAWTVAKQLNLKPSLRLTLLSLAEYANDNLSCWPSIARLADDTGKKERQIKRDLAELEWLGAITIDRGGGSGRTSRYIINSVTHDTIGDKKGVTHDTKKVSPMTKKVSPMTKKGVTHDTRTVRNRNRTVNTTETDPNIQALDDIDKIMTAWERARGTKVATKYKNDSERSIAILLNKIDWNVTQAVSLILAKRQEMLKSNGFKPIAPCHVIDKIMDEIDSKQVVSQSWLDLWQIVLDSEGDVQKLTPEVKAIVRPIWVKKLMGRSRDQIMTIKDEFKELCGL